MRLRHRSLVIVIVLVLPAAAACSSRSSAALAQPEVEIAATTTTTRPTTTSTSTPPAPPITVTGVPDELAGLVESIFEHAAGVGTSSVEGAYLPERGVAEGMAGRTAVGATAEVDDWRLGVVEAGGDLVAAVDDGDGWRVVAVDLPSLDHRHLGYTSAVIAVVGSDARPGEDPTTARADSLHLVGFDGVAGTFDIVGIPRDSWVDIDGGSPGKINSALSTGGPGRMAATLEALAGYPLDGMILTGFEGFQEALGDVLGGIQITLDHPVSDRAAGADFRAGEQYMNGPQALAFARTRKTLPGGDLDRQRNGGLVLIAAAATAATRDVTLAPALLAEATGWVWTDLDPATLVRLAVTARLSPVFDVANVVLPGVPGRRGSAATIELALEAGPILADLADGALED